MGFGSTTDWRGVYNHDDSGPTWLGPEVWRAVVSARAKGEGWGALEEEVLRAGRWEAFARGDRAAEAPVITAESADPLSIEWIYVVDSAVGRLHVLGKAPASAGLDEWRHDLAGSFELDGAEPDWGACERAHARRHAASYLASIRERFGEEAYASARRQMLGDEE